MSDWAPADLALRERFRGGAGVVDAALAPLGDDDLDCRVGDGWSPRMIAHHLADAEVHIYERLRQLLADPEPVPILYWDEARWAATPALRYESGPIAPSLDLFRAARAASVALLDELPATELDREGTHSTDGAFSVRHWLAMAAAHAEDHAAQITATGAEAP